MPRSDNPYDLINALENRYKELTMTASSDINASNDIGERFVDTDGFFGVPGKEISWNEITEYWNNNHEDDPILAKYPTFDAWWSDTSTFLMPIEDCSAINGAEDVIDEEIIPEEDEIEDVYIDPEFAEVRDQLINYNIATADEIDLVCEVTDKKTVEILNKILNIRTGYDDIETYIGEVYPE